MQSPPYQVCKGLTKHFPLPSWGAHHLLIEELHLESISHGPKTQVFPDIQSSICRVQHMEVLGLQVFLVQSLHLRWMWPRHVQVYQSSQGLGCLVRLLGQLRFFRSLVLVVAPQLCPFRWQFQGRALKICWGWDLSGPGIGCRRGVGQPWWSGTSRLGAGLDFGGLDSLLPKGYFKLESLVTPGFRGNMPYQQIGCAPPLGKIGTSHGCSFGSFCFHSRNIS